MSAADLRKGLRIGGGSAFFNDRLDAALELVEQGDLDVLMIETLAERTLALLQGARRSGQPGYFPRLRERLETLLPACAHHRVALVSNGGGADPAAAAAMACEVARGAGLSDLKVAAILGDDVAEQIRALDPVVVETGEPVSRQAQPILSANAYLGAAGIAEACAAGADVVLTGRVTDSALALGPLQAHFGWGRYELDALACGVMAGHLLECGGQATGGYFAEPGLKEVPDLDRLGFPIAEVSADLSIGLGKPAGTGGRVDRHTVTEQLLYEIHDPARYLTPDVTLDLTDVTIAQTGTDAVRLTGARGHAPPGTLKVLLGVDGGTLVEIEISYAGIGARGRAQLAAEIVRRRIARTALAGHRVRFDLIGIDSLWPGKAEADPAPMEIRLRVAARLPDMGLAERLVTEVESLYVNGPSGGGGVRFSLRPTIQTLTAFIPAGAASARCVWLEA